MRLCDYKEAALYAGTVFRFSGKYPFEENVDFMLVCYPDTESGFARTVWWKQSGLSFENMG